MQPDVGGIPFSESDSPGVRAAKVHDWIGGHLRAVLDATRTKITDAAEAMAMDRSDLYDVFEGRKKLQALRLYLLDDAPRLLLARSIAGGRYLVTALPNESELGKTAHGLMVALGEVSGAVIEALHDPAERGKLTRAQGVALERAADKGLSLLAAVRELGRRAQREDVITLAPTATRRPA